MRTQCSLLVTLGLFAACTGNVPEPTADVVTGEVAQPQLTVSDDALLLLWRSPGDQGSDLFVARHRGDWAFSEPVRVNDVERSVSSFDLDELRPSVAVGPGGLVAVAWGDNDGNVRVTISRDQGLTFPASVRLNGDTGDAAQSFPSIAFDRKGMLHAVWVSGSIELGFSEPERVGPPLWELSGCPMAGPVVVGKETLWNDGSTGERRTLLHHGSDEPPWVLLASDETFNVLYPPRQVAGEARSGTLFLVPGDPAGRLVRLDPDGEWEVLPEEPPRWATSGAFLDGELFLVGVVEGEPRLQTLPLSL
jgi:hypothetical protein